MQLNYGSKPKHTLSYKLRKQQNMDAKYIADYCGVSVSMIWTYERGEVMPKVDVAEKIADILYYHGTLSDLFKVVD